MRACPPVSGCIGPSSPRTRHHLHRHADTIPYLGQARRPRTHQTTTNATQRYHPGTEPPRCPLPAPTDRLPGAAILALLKNSPAAAPNVQPPHMRHARTASPPGHRQPPLQWRACTHGAAADARLARARRSASWHPQGGLDSSPYRRLCRITKKLPSVGFSCHRWSTGESLPWRNTIASVPETVVAKRQYPEPTVI